MCAVCAVGSSIPAIIVGSVSAVLVFIMIIITIVVLIIILKLKQKCHAQQQNCTITNKHGNSLVIHVQGDREPHTHEMPQHNHEEQDLQSCEAYDSTSIINHARQAVPTSPSVVHGYDYPVKPEIPTVSSVAYDHNSMSEPVRRDILTTPCEAYDRNSATNPLRRGINNTQCVAYDQ